MAPTVDVAARDNAEWCHAVCSTHGITGSFGPRAWTCATRTPPMYPDAVTLHADATEADVLPRIDTDRPGCSVKDSFARLDLHTAGFRVLFEAEWIGLDDPGTTADPGWRRIREPDAFARWEAAWRDDDPSAVDVLRHALVDRDDVCILGRDDGERVMAGAVLSCIGPVVGVSNLFATDGDLDRAWAGVLGRAAVHTPGRALVGYWSGPELGAALRAGFERLGPLRVWIAEP